MQRPAPQEHSVQLFDSPDSVAAAVSEFLLEGFAAGESLLVVATPAHREGIDGRLRAAGMPVDAAIASGSLTVLDAAETLKSFAPYGWVDGALFEQSVSTLVKSLTAGGRRLRVYGEIVDLLAGKGRLETAMRLEEAWSELARHVPFTLLCGYSAVHFGNPRAAEALQQICGAHSHVRSNPHDVLASFLLNSALT